MTAVVAVAPLQRDEAGAPRPWSFQTLEAHLGSPSTTETARRLGVDRRQVYRWRETGLTDRQADHLAIRCGTHPALIWPCW